MKPSLTSVISCDARGHGIQCISLGKKRPLVVTGGRNRRANVWRIDIDNKNSPSLTFPSGQSPVLSSVFNHSEDAFCVGSSGGTVKIYDICGGKQARNLNGHLSSVDFVNYHPFGDFVTTASADTNIKVWDVRNKSCVKTFQNHNER